MPRRQMTPEEQLRYDAFMSQSPVLYRGFSIRPVSHKFQPFYVAGRWYYYGYMICSKDGSLNLSPGAVWGHTLDWAMGAIDCMHDTGLPYRFDEYGQYLETTKATGWADRYWQLMKERGLYGQKDVNHAA